MPALKEAGLKERTRAAPCPPLVIVAVANPVIWDPLIHDVKPMAWNQNGLTRVIYDTEVLG